MSLWLDWSLEGVGTAGEEAADVPQMDTAIQIGPTGKKLLPLTVKNAGPRRLRAVTRTDLSEALDRMVEALAG